MHADCAILTGARHLAVAGPCQDYSLARMLGPDCGVAIVADGCSTGGQTDLGARAWAHSALRLVQASEAILAAEALQQALLAKAPAMLDGLETQDGLATLAVLQAQGRRLEAAFWGDGALLARHMDGSLTLVSLEFSGNAPPYLQYGLDKEALQAWQQDYPQELLVITNRYDPDGVLISLNTTARVATLAPWIWQAHLDTDDLELVAVATDGVSSRTGGFVQTGQQILAVKGSQGEFLRRRLGRQARDWEKERDMPADDLAVAALWVGN